MLILGIEAAAKACSAAVYEDGTVLAQVRSNAGMTHSETLLPMVDQALTLAGKAIENVDAIALTKGPGSFTGLRIGAATAKGLALGIRKPLIPLDTLEALTYTQNMGDFIRVGIMDARRGQVYCAAYQTKSEEGAPAVCPKNSVVIPPDALAPSQLLEKLQQTRGDLVFFGDAVPLYRNRLKESLGSRYHEAPAAIRELNAASVCALAEDKIKLHPELAVPGDELVLEYLRKPQAEREREARLGSETTEAEMSAAVEAMARADISVPIEKEEKG
ncbi:MAG: tRNA (adenosine(37)-N6)-threonylcarbamoyltransferase complex dimerization subunit type 1 TsaB [Lachnospiraceae bacterium]|nr:tRNA (adenosine(37)-N6)-threonylcarbamoyltransferase complex dimerization subunit type 1 TsaB [Lachnospiraceae bacterium]